MNKLLLITPGESSLILHLYALRDIWREDTLCFLKSTPKGSCCFSLIPNSTQLQMLLIDSSPRIMSNRFISSNLFLNKVCFLLCLSLGLQNIIFYYLTCKRALCEVGECDLASYNWPLMGHQCPRKFKPIYGVAQSQTRLKRLSSSSSSSSIFWDLKEDIWSIDVVWEGIWLPMKKSYRIKLSCKLQEDRVFALFITLLWEPGMMLEIQGFIFVKSKRITTAWHPICCPASGLKL